MELKDVILSTLAEMEERPPMQQKQTPNFEVKETKRVVLEEKPPISKPLELPKEQTIESELLYLSSIRERLLVLFEGFQAPNNANIEAKVDLTLNFLEYVLANIDKRVTLLEKGKTK